jgi:UDP-glucose 4-epimerase
MQVKGKSVLVTGGAGFIGSHIVDRLLLEGAYVKILDDLSNGDITNIPNTKKVEFQKGDIRNDNDVKRALEGIDLVFHEAAQINPARAVKDPVYDFEVNARGTLNLLLASVKNGVKKFIMASTNTYGDASTGLMSEKFSTLSEPRSLLSPYAAAKVSAEAYLKTINDEFGMPTVRLRYFNVYGPRQTTKSESGVIAIFTEQILAKKPIAIFGDGTHTRDFIHVDDVVEANILAALKEQINGEVFNVGTGIETSIIELAKLIIKITGTNVPIIHAPPRAADFRRAKADLEKTGKFLGFQPKINLQDGLVDYIHWFRTNKKN